MQTLPSGTDVKPLLSASSAVSPHRPSNTYILNKCEEALVLQRFNKRHDSVLSLINTFIATHLKRSSILADLPGQQNTFPVHIAVIDEQPDIVIWNEKH